MIDSHVVHLDDVVYRNNKQLIAYDEYIYIYKIQCNNSNSCLQIFQRLYPSGHYIYNIL